MNIQEFAAEIESRNERKRDFIVQSSDAEFAIEKEPGMRSPAAVIRFAGETYELNKTARSQLSNRLKIPARFFDRMSSDYPERLSDLVNEIFENEENDLMIRTLDGRARAVLSNHYRMIDNFDVFKAILPKLEELDFVDVASCHLNDDAMHLKLVFPDVSAKIGSPDLGDFVQHGVHISNSETGRGTFAASQLAFRLVCLNGMMLPVTMSSQQRRHVGPAYEPGTYEIAAEQFTLADDIRERLEASIDRAHFDTSIDLMNNATERTFEEPEALVESVARVFSLSESLSESILSTLVDPNTPGQRMAGQTQWGLVNAVTFLANNSKSYEEATRLEELGGNILKANQHKWDHILATA